MKQVVGKRQEQRCGRAERSEEHDPWPQKAEAATGTPPQG